MQESNEYGEPEGKLEGSGPGARGSEDRSPEVEAFIKRFNYFRKPYNAWEKNGTGWKEAKKRNGEAAYAGDRVVQDAIDGKGDIGMRLSYTTTFFGFDIDTPGKGKVIGRGKGRAEGAASAGAIGNRQGRVCGHQSEELLKGGKSRGGSGLLEEEGGEDQEKAEEEKQERERIRELERKQQEAIANWEGWKEYGFEDDHGLVEFFASMPKIPIEEEEHKPENAGGPEGESHQLSNELKAAARLLQELVVEEPSLVQRSPHGVHLYWCLDESRAWKSEVRPLLEKVLREYRRRSRVEGIKNSIEILPSTSKPLRVPRKDRLLEPRTLEPIAKSENAEAFWRGLRTSPLEGLIRPEMWGESGTENEEEPGRRRPEVEEADDEAAEIPRREYRELGHDDIFKLRPKNHVEAEALLMPFENGQSNAQLVKMIEGGKREGMGLGQVEAWIEGWEERSKEAGYVGDLFDNRETLRARVESLYQSSRAIAAGATRFIELWKRENRKYPRNEEAAARALAQLEAVSKQPRQSRRAVLRFFEDIDVWKRVVDDAVADPASGIDAVLINNRTLGRYPLPHKLLREMYSGYQRIWENTQTAGIVRSADDAEGGYVPILGRPQYYYLDI
jgi:hypothetical protein